MDAHSLLVIFGAILLRTRAAVKTERVEEQHVVSLPSRDRGLIHRSMLVVFEGVDRSGKSTQCALLQAHLEAAFPAATVHLLRYPDRKDPFTGPLIEAYLGGSATAPASATPSHAVSTLSLHAASLILAANLWQMRDAVVEALNTGAQPVVIMDRYTWSNVAYSTARGMDRRTFEAINSGLPVPDLIVYMDADVAATSQRAGFGKERYDNVPFQAQVAATMASLYEAATSGKDQALDATLQQPPEVLSIDASGDRDAIATAIMRRVTALLASRYAPPLQAAH